MYRAALDACPSHAPAHFSLGVMASEARDWATALAAYGRAVELQPRYAQVWGGGRRLAGPCVHCCTDRRLGASCGEGPQHLMCEW